jgi:hypothetical protein
MRRNHVQRQEFGQHLRVELAVFRVLSAITRSFFGCASTTRAASGSTNCTNHS